MATFAPPRTGVREMARRHQVSNQQSEMANLRLRDSGSCERIQPPSCWSGWLQPIELATHQGTSMGQTGAGDAFWASNPLQIGMYNDPGLDALLSGKEGGDLILPESIKSRLDRANARAVPSYNIRAGIGYLLMRLANFSIQSVPDIDQRTYEITVKQGDSLDKIARAQGSTTETLRALNPGVSVLRPGQVLKYQKAALRKIIVGWKPRTTANIGSLYNTKDPVAYAKKLDYALAAIRRGKESVCTP
jgi:hypothetical protein